MRGVCSAQSEAMTSPLNFSESRKAALVRGFWKGLAAPLLLFSSFDLPAQARPQGFQPLPKRAGHQESDWTRVGRELRNAALQERKKARG